jgi:hypothetical protein
VSLRLSFIVRCHRKDFCFAQDFCEYDGVACRFKIPVERVGDLREGEPCPIFFGGIVDTSTSGQDDRSDDYVPQPVPDCFKALVNTWQIERNQYSTCSHPCLVISALGSMKGGDFDTLEFYAGPGRSLQGGINFGPRPGLRNGTLSIMSPPESFVSSISSGVAMERSLRSVRIPERNHILARFLGMSPAESSN